MTNAAAGSEFGLAQVVIWGPIDCGSGLATTNCQSSSILSGTVGPGYCAIPSVAATASIEAAQHDHRK